MPRPQAVEEVVEQAQENGEAQGVKRRRRATGPRKPSVKFLLVEIKDKDGNVVENAQLRVITETKDIATFVKASRANPQATLVQVGGNDEE